MSKPMNDQMRPKTVSELDLSEFTGTDYWYKHTMVEDVLYTDGVRYVAVTCESYWLIDLIACAQLIKKVKDEEFQVWTLIVTNQKGVLTGDDGNGNVIYREEIEYTTFPEGEMKFYMANKVIMLTSEY